MRSRYRCSMCPAIHISSRSWLRSSSTHEPSDPPLRVVIVSCLSQPASTRTADPRNERAGNATTRSACAHFVSEICLFRYSDEVTLRTGAIARSDSLNLASDELHAVVAPEGTDRDRYPQTAFGRKAIVDRRARKRKNVRATARDAAARATAPLSVLENTSDSLSLAVRRLAPRARDRSEDERCANAVRHPNAYTRVSRSRAGILRRSAGARRAAPPIVRPRGFGPVGPAPPEFHVRHRSRPS